MTEYTIRPLVVAKIASVKGVTTHLVDVMTPVVAPVLVFYIEGGAKKILVDTGIVDFGSGYFDPLRNSGTQGMINALAEIGLKPADIDLVIITHLHFDHAGNIDLFPHAQFILQKKEWAYAKNPLPIQQDVYISELFARLESYDLLLVDDGYEVADGVNVICVPGHTKGQQAVVVNSKEGKYVIAGDLLYSYINIYPEKTEMLDVFGNAIPCTPQPGHAFYPPGIHTDLSDWYDSVWRVLKIAGSRKHIIPGHDPALIGKVFPE